MRGNKQAGFSIVEAVIGVAVVGITGIAGVFVYQHNQAKAVSALANPNQTSNQQIPTTPTSAQPAQATSTVNIPELGISITVPNAIKDLTYQVSTVTLTGGTTGNRQGTLAVFSTASLAAADAKCGPQSGQLGSLQKVEGQYPTPSEDQYAALDYGHLVKQFPTFFISAGSPNGTCSTSKSLPTGANNFKQYFAAAQSTIQPLSTSGAN